jgi:exosortase/archaeosortase family protein
MTLHWLIQNPRRVHAAVRLDTAPTWLWPGLLAAALWPCWLWMGQRMADGSDDPMGLLALLALAGVVYAHRLRLRAAPRLRWLAAALAGVLCVTALHSAGTVAPLVLALLGVLSLAAGLAAFLPSGVASGPVLGLSVLSLPLLASLQFYAGYPLRVLTAQASSWLLSCAYSVQRSGASLQIDGQLILVDAPCSGVQMVWLGYFSACVVALHQGRSNRAFFSRLPAVGVLVLTGNVLRNTVLVAFEASGAGLHGWAHDVVGLVVLAAVCVGIAACMARTEHTTAHPQHTESVLSAKHHV